MNPDPLAKARSTALLNFEIARSLIPRALGYGGARPVTDAEERAACGVVDRGLIQRNKTTRVLREGRIPHTTNKLIPGGRQWSGDDISPALAAKVMRARGVFEAWIKNLPKTKVLLNGERVPRE